MPVGKGGRLLVGLGIDGSGLELPVGIEGPGSEGEPGIDGSGLRVPVEIGGPDTVKELVSEDPVLLEVVWLQLALDRVELPAVDPTGEDSEDDKLTDVELDRGKLLLYVAVIEELLGGKGIGVTMDVLLELDRPTELDRVVSVDHELDVWLDVVSDRLEPELFSGGMTIGVLVDEVAAVTVVEDLSPLLSPLVVLKTVELPWGAEGDADDAGIPGEEVSIGGRVLMVGLEYVLKVG